MSKMDEIKDKAKEVAEKAKDVAGDIKDKAKDVAGNVKDKLDKDHDGDIDAFDKVKGLFKKDKGGAEAHGEEAGAAAESESPTEDAAPPADA